jgi:hypothetical protein
MRNLFLALVLANLAFAAWSAWLAPSQVRGRPADEGLPALTLVSEVPEDLRSSGVVVQEPGAPEPSPGEAPPTPAIDAPPSENEEERSPVAPPAEELPARAEPLPSAARCTSVGPFLELSQAATAAATLRAAGFEPLQRVVEGDVWSGYWVYIPALPTEQQANEALAKIREGVPEARIADAYVIRNSDTGNLISLGVFTEIGGVGRLREEVRALGFEPQVVDRTRRATVYWIDVTLASDQMLDFDSLQQPGRIVRLEQRDCERPPP